MLEEVAEACVRLLRRAEAGELAHRPEPAAVHRRVDAARKRIGARPAEIALVVELDVLGRVERLVLDAGDGRGELSAALRRRLVARTPSGAARLVISYWGLPRRRHRRKCRSLASTVARRRRRRWRCARGRSEGRRAG